MQASTMALDPEDLEEVRESDLATHVFATQVVDQNELEQGDENLPRLIRRGLLALGVVALLGGAAAFVIRHSRNEPATAVSPPVAQVPTLAEPAPSPDAVGTIVSRAQELLKQGDRGGALDLLVASRVTYPNDARLPRLAAIIFFDRLWWADGIKQLHAAFELDPSLRQDPEIVAMVVVGFNTTPTHNALLARCLREDIGAAAMPSLERVAREHHNPKIRARAAAELRRLAPN